MGVISDYMVLVSFNFTIYLELKQGRITLYSLLYDAIDLLILKIGGKGLYFIRNM